VKALSFGENFELIQNYSFLLVSPNKFSGLGYFFFAGIDIVFFNVNVNIYDAQVGTLKVCAFSISSLCRIALSFLVFILWMKYHILSLLTFNDLLSFVQFSRLSISL
jgi:hypothetical protein